MNAKKERIAFAIVLSTLMSGAMPQCYQKKMVTLFNLGFVSGFAWLWLKAMAKGMAFLTYYSHARYDDA